MNCSSFGYFGGRGGGKQLVLVVLWSLFSTRELLPFVEKMLLKLFNLNRRFKIDISPLKMALSEILAYNKHITVVHTFNSKSKPTSFTVRSHCI